MMIIRKSASYARDSACSFMNCFLLWNQSAKYIRYLIILEYQIPNIKVPNI